MKVLLILIIHIITVFSCDLHCKTCSGQSPYQCASCYTNPTANLYVKSCQQLTSAIQFLVIGIIVIIIHLVMIILGYGVYRNVFQNLQMLSLVSWGYSNLAKSSKLAILNFGYVVNNNFLTSFGAQFFIAITIIGIFGVIVFVLDKLPHNSIATLIKRKKIIFPLRVQSLLWNMTLFCALSQVCTIGQSSSTDAVDIIVSISALIKQLAVICLIFYITNWSNFQIDDHKYYVLIEKLASSRWYARNNFVFSLLIRALIIIFFIALFDNPNIAGLLMLGTMMIYTLVSAIGMKFIKLRFWIFNLLANLLTCGAIFCMWGCGTSEMTSSKWQSYRNAYYIIVLTLCALFLFINIMEIIANNNQMFKQILSIYLRFIICEKIDDAIELNKYDIDKHRQKVTSFRRNLIYKMEINDAQITEQKQ